MPKNTPERIIDKRPIGSGYVFSSNSTGGGSGVTDHGSLTGLGDDDHSQYLNNARGDARYVPLSRSVYAGSGLTGGGVLSGDVTLALASSIAGSGLTFSGGVVNVGAGNGITVNADDVALASTAAGAGLTYSLGVLDVGAGLGITVNANDVALASSVAGNGLTYTLGVLDVVAANTGPATGLTVEANAIRLTASDSPGAAASILASNSSGVLTLPQFIATTKVRTPLLDTASGAMTLQPVTDLLLQPGSNLVKLQSNINLQSANYASQTTGMRVTYDGQGDFRYLYTDEMHAKSFIADLEQALAGGQIISKSVAVLAATFTAPTAGNSTVLRVRDLPSAPDMAVFQSGDYVRLRTFSRSAGSLTIADCWGTVVSYIDQTDGTQTWTFVRSAAPNAGTMAAGTTIAPDAIVLDYGTTGNGFYEVNAIDGAYGVNSPYAQVVTWATHPVTQTVRARLGNLYGIFSQSNEYGLYAGGGTANTDSYLRISNNTVRLNNVPLQLWYNNGVTTNQTVNISSSGTDVWIGTSSSDKKLEWNGSTLTVRGAIVVQAGSSGYSNLTDKPTSLSGINSGEGTKLSGIAAGATVGATWGSNLGSIPARFGDAPIGGSAGLYMTASNMGYWDGSNWKTWMASTGQFYFGGSSGASLRWDGTKLSGYDSGNTEQWYASATDGRLYAGAGNAMLDRKGLRFLMVDDSVNGYNEVKWSYTATAAAEFRLLAIRTADNNVTATISTQAQTAGKASTLYIASYKQDATFSSIIMNGNVSVSGTFSTTTTTTVPSLKNTGGAFYSDNAFWFYNLAGSGYQSIATASIYNTSGYNHSDSGFKFRNWGSTAWQQVEAGAVYAYDSLTTPTIYNSTPVNFMNGSAAQAVKVASVLASSNYSHYSRVPSYGVYSLGGVRTGAFMEIDSVTGTQLPLATGAASIYLHYSTIDGKYRFVFALDDGSGTKRYAYINMSNITGSGSTSFIVNTTAPT